MSREGICYVSRSVCVREEQVDHDILVYCLLNGHSHLLNGPTHIRVYCLLNGLRVY